MTTALFSAPFSRLPVSAHQVSFFNTLEGF